MLVDVGIKPGKRQLCTGALRGRVQTGEQQDRPLPGDQRVRDRAGGEPLHQLFLARVEGVLARGAQQPSAGLGVAAQRVFQPLLVRHIQHQAATALCAVARMVSTGRDHHDVLLA